MLTEENATVLPFRDAALRRPIDVVAWMNSYVAPAQPVETPANVVPLSRFTRSSRGVRRRLWCDGPPDGEAA